MEIREFRCCMCPNISKPDNKICPTRPGKDKVTLCNFTFTWTDSRGWKYKVMGDLTSTFKGRYQDDKHKGDTGWHGMRQLERRGTFDQAQEDLNRLAKSRGWTPAMERKAAYIDEDFEQAVKEMLDNDKCRGNKEKKG